MKIIDLRSDTVTHPTKEMRETAMNAQVGDDVFGDDPTVNELETYAAKLSGKESALFVTSGTQGNLISVLCHTTHGDEVLLEADSHIYHYEVGGISAIAGAIPKLIKTVNGEITPEHVKNVLRGENIHFPKTTLLCLENTHNRHGGTAISPESTNKVAKYAKEQGLKVHLDGARIFNACIYHNTDLKEYTKNVDTIQFCLSKGLSAPIGSIIASDKETIDRARKFRKMLGGGMRQVGIIAAPGLVALKTMRDRLIEDHKNAQRIATILKEKGFEVIKPQTNIVVVSIINKFENPMKAVDYFEKAGILCVPFGSDKIRFTTHRMIAEEDVTEFERRLSSLH